MIRRYPDPKQVWPVLVTECGADPDGLDNFVATWPECREYRFQGALGFGGKVWANLGKVYVTCYPENETAVRHAMIEAANARLAQM